MARMSLKKMVMMRVRMNDMLVLDVQVYLNKLHIVEANMKMMKMVVKSILLKVMVKAMMRKNLNLKMKMIPLKVMTVVTTEMKMKMKKDESHSMSSSHTSILSSFSFHS